MTEKKFAGRSKLGVMFSYIKPHKRDFIIDMMLSLIIAVIDLVFPYVSRWAMMTLLLIWWRVC